MLKHIPSVAVFLIATALASAAIAADQQSAGAAYAKLQSDGYILASQATNAEYAKRIQDATGNKPDVVAPVTVGGVPNDRPTPGAVYWQNGTAVVEVRFPDGYTSYAKAGDVVADKWRVEIDKDKGKIVPVAQERRHGR